MTDEREKQRSGANSMMLVGIIMMMLGVVTGHSALTLPDLGLLFLLAGRIKLLEQKISNPDHS